MASVRPFRILHLFALMFALTVAVCAPALARNKSPVADFYRGKQVLLIISSSPGGGIVATNDIYGAVAQNGIVIGHRRTPDGNPQSFLGEEKGGDRVMSIAS